MLLVHLFWRRQRKVWNFSRLCRSLSSKFMESIFQKLPMIAFSFLPFRLILLLLVLIYPLCDAICYYPDGQTVAPQDVPCLGGTDASACCGAGYACLSNGLCMSTNATHDTQSSNTYVRGSCTDQQWRAAACPAFCIDPKLGTLLDDNSLSSRHDVETDDRMLMSSYR